MIFISTFEAIFIVVKREWDKCRGRERNDNDILSLEYKQRNYANIREGQE